MAVSVNGELSESSDDAAIEDEDEFLAVRVVKSMLRAMGHPSLPFLHRGFMRPPIRCLWSGVNLSRSQGGTSRRLRPHRKSGIGYSREDTQKNKYLHEQRIPGYPS